jgi:hypothetical protein
MRAIELSRKFSSDAWPGRISDSRLGEFTESGRGFPIRKLSDLAVLRVWAEFPGRTA